MCRGIGRSRWRGGKDEEQEEGARTEREGKIEGDNLWVWEDITRKHRETGKRGGEEKRTREVTFEAFWSAEPTWTVNSVFWSSRKAWMVRRTSNADVKIRSPNKMLPKLSDTFWGPPSGSQKWNSGA
jgi:hypothetical protein